MSTQRALAQINPNYGYYRTIVNTTWLYPPADVAKGLAASTYKYTFDGTFIICPDIENLIGLYNDIFVQTAISQPVGNVGIFSRCRYDARKLWKNNYLASTQWKHSHQMATCSTNNATKYKLYSCPR